MNELNLKDNIVLRYVDRIEIENFSHFIPNNCGVEASHISKGKSIENYISNILTYVDSSHGEDYLNVCVRLDTFELPATKFCKHKVIYELSLIDCHENAYFSKVDCNIIDKPGLYVLKNPIQLAYLLKAENEFLTNDKLTIKCKILIIESCEKFNLSNTEILCKNNQKNISVSKSVFNGKLRPFASHSHKWTIDNFDCIFQDWKMGKIKSDEFCCDNTKFFITCKIYPKCISIYLFTVESGSSLPPSSHSSFVSYDEDAKPNRKIQQVCDDKIGNSMGRYCISTIDVKAEKRNLNSYNSHQVQQAIIRNHANGLLPDGKLVICCEIQLLKDDRQQVNPIKQEDNQSVVITQSESYSNITPKVISSLSHKWTIDNFAIFREWARLRSQVKIWRDYKIKSTKFFSSNKEIQFHIEFCNNNFENNQSDHSLRLYAFCATADDYRVNSRNDKSHVKSGRGILSNNKKNMKLNDISISMSDLGEQNGLLDNGKLTILCELKLLEGSTCKSELIQQSTQYAIESFTMPWKAMKLSDATFSSETFTSTSFATSSPLKWTIDCSRTAEKYDESENFCFSNDCLNDIFYLSTSLSSDPIRVDLNWNKFILEKISLKLYILSGNKRKFCAQSDLMNAKVCWTNVDCVKLPKNEYLKDNHLLVGNKLKMEFELIVLSNTASGSVNEPQKILPELSSLLTDRLDTDIVLKFRTDIKTLRNLYAHKSIIATTFKLKSLCKTKTCEMADVDIEIFEEILRFVYTGKVNRQQVKKFTGKVLIASNKYKLKQLKSVCEDIFIEKLQDESEQSIQHLSKLLQFSNEHNASRLERKCIKLISKKRKRSDISDSESSS